FCPPQWQRQLQRQLRRELPRLRSARRKLPVEAKVSQAEADQHAASPDSGAAAAAAAAFGAACHAELARLATLLRHFGCRPPEPPSPGNRCQFRSATARCVGLLALRTSALPAGSAASSVGGGGGCVGCQRWLTHSASGQAAEAADDVRVEAQQRQAGARRKPRNFAEDLKTRSHLSNPAGGGYAHQLVLLPSRFCAVSAAAEVAAEAGLTRPSQRAGQGDAAHPADAGGAGRGERGAQEEQPVQSDGHEQPGAEGCGHPISLGQEADGPAGVVQVGLRERQEQQEQQEVVGRQQSQAGVRQCRRTGWRPEHAKVEQVEPRPRSSWRHSGSPAARSWRHPPRISRRQQSHVQGNAPRNPLTPDNLEKVQDGLRNFLVGQVMRIDLQGAAGVGLLRRAPAGGGQRGGHKKQDAFSRSFVREEKQRLRIKELAPTNLRTSASSGGESKQLKKFTDQETAVNARRRVLLMNPLRRELEKEDGRLETASALGVARVRVIEDRIEKEKERDEGAGSRSSWAASAKIQSWFRTSWSEEPRAFGQEEEEGKKAKGKGKKGGKKKK
uniref:Ribosome biogenesis protein NOP53 n=1 Tax=Macrostomum lignano TaxID=282301 RepID=A0A1I8FQ54_9PLAT